MPERVVHSTIVLERKLTAAPERVFEAFANGTMKRRWFANAAQNEVEEFAVDCRVGGEERLRYRFKEGTPLPGAVLESRGTYLEIVPGRRIVSSSTMALGGRVFSASLVTVELIPDGAGTELVVTHQGAFFEGADGPAMREQGWRTLLDSLEATLES
ncbi:MAG: SRPBCC family protein [Terracidiphilus sp.]